MKIIMFYTTSETLAFRIRRGGRRLAMDISGLEEFGAWKAEAKAFLIEKTGMHSMIPCNPNPQQIFSKQEDGYIRQKMTIETEPGIIMPFYVLLPDGLKQGEKRPAILAPHGHGFGAKDAISGVRDNPVIAQRIDEAHCDYGLQLVKEGFVVFCPDARGMGERRERCYQEAKHVLSTSCQILANIGGNIGQYVAGMWTWDNMRLLDYMQNRPEVDKNRIGCAGLSGGGLQSMWLAALDPRIKCYADSGYFYGADQSLIDMPQNCACNYVPGLWSALDMCDIAALAAPRPVLFETGDIDSLNGADGLQNVYPQVNALKKAYSLFCAEEDVVHHVFHGPHMWNGEKAIPFLKKHLNI